MLINLLFLCASLSSFWNVSINNIGRYSLSFKNRVVIDNNCPNFILSDYGTRVSPCDQKLYSLPTMYSSTNKSYKNFNNVTKVIISYKPVSNIKLPIINTVFISPNNPNNYSSLGY